MNPVPETLPPCDHPGSRQVHFIFENQRPAAITLPRSQWEAELTSGTVYQWTVGDSDADFIATVPGVRILAISPRVLEIPPPAVDDNPAATELVRTLYRGSESFRKLQRMTVPCGPFEVDESANLLMVEVARTATETFSRAAGEIGIDIRAKWINILDSETNPDGRRGHFEFHLYRVDPSATPDQ